MATHIELAEQAGFSREGIQEMHQAALEVLRTLGIAVENQQALQSLREAGVRIGGQRAYFEPELVEKHLAALQAEWSERRPAAQKTQLTCGVGDMCQYYHNPHNDAIELMTTANLVEATRSVQTMRSRGLGSYVPGVPRDVPPQLQAIVEYRIGAEFVSGGPTLDTLYPPEALEYLFALAEAYGQPMRATNVFPVSPLRLSGYEFDLAIAHRDRWEAFSVTTYPAAGISAPVRFRAAWVQSIAEALGGAAVLRIAGGGKPVSISVGMFPFDLRTLTIVGGMPECAWMYWASAQINRFYNPAAGYSMMLGTQAKRPGVQAGMEKGMAGTFGIVTGCDDFHYIGVMSFDDIFSPEQMVADLELRDALEQLRCGIPRENPQSWIDVIREGVDRGYLETPTTLDGYKEAYWYSRLFDRLSWHSYQHANGKTARQRARDEVLSRLAGYDFHPPEAVIQDVRRIFDQAWNRLGGDPHAEVLSLLYNEA